MTIGVMGATGPAGSGLAARLASVGHDVVLGSRARGRAEAVVLDQRKRWGDRVATLRAGTNGDAVQADLVVLAVPWDAAATTAKANARDLAGKVVVSMANGLERHGREFRAVLPEGSSVAAAVQAAAPDAQVVAAFQHVPAAAFGNLAVELTSDVVIAGDDDAARAAVLDLIATVPGLRGFDAGSLVQAEAIEAFAAVILSINVRSPGRARASLRFAGIEPASPR